MSLLGKILAVLNVLVAGGVVFLLALDYGQRRSWAYAVHLHDLYIDGLPADDREKDAEGTPQVSKLPAKGVEEYFRGLDRGVPTQRAELERVRGVLASYVAGDNPTQEQRLAQVLRPLARTLSEREDLSSRMTAPKGDPKELKELQDKLEARFAAAVDPSITPEERKLRASRLLFGLVEGLDLAARAGGAASATPEAPPPAAPGAPPAGPAGAPAGDPLDSNAFKRFVRVVGLRAATRELDAQAAAYENLAAQTDTAHEAERDQFVGQYARLLYEIQNLADDLQDQVRFLAAKKGETASQRKLADDREELLKQLQKDLKDLQDSTRDRLASLQTPLENQLLDTLRRARDQGKLTAEAARELRRLEGLRSEP